MKGTLKPNINKVVYLFQVVDGETKLVKSCSLADDGSFLFSIDQPNEGFYMIGGFTAAAGQFPIYLKKGDKAQLSIDNRQMEFTGKQTDENKLYSNENAVLNEWIKLTRELKSQIVILAGPKRAVNPQAEFAAVNQKTADFQKNINTKNTKFNLLMKQIVNYEMDFYALSLIKKNNGIIPESLAEYGKTLFQKDKFKSDDVFLYTNGKALITLYADYAASISKMEEGTNFLSTDRQKGTYIFDRMSPKVKTYPEFEAMLKAQGKYFNYASLKTKVDAFGTKLYKATPGRKAANFSFPDQDGKMVSLSDFKGKVVLVDVWATFCGPCKELIPALNQLEADLHDHKDLVFVGVAQDGPRARNTWLKIIKEKQMGGIQLFAGGGNNILASDYKIKVMPRYLIFDRQGNVVTTEAPLPSNPGLKKMLLVELAK
ncbi:TlpA disulfide reductase family protein [Pedobacter nutrimenti]|uniref:TlpA family protein disulfide reductase n=1 Tax=Pedobacter nutrimenti TaxID=1241337 RepID=UPI0029302CAF|nr:TlpA disulfide reductase family protein [Pedobacter nutrimenti]